MSDVHNGDDFVGIGASSAPDTFRTQPSTFPQPSGTPPRPMPRGKMLAALLTAGLLGICACGGLGVFVVANLGDDSCSVGYRGSQASVTLKGRASSATCKQIIANSPSSWYLLPDSPSEPIICKRTVEGYQVTVRDQGVIPFNGQVFCDSLAQTTRITSFR